MRSFCAHWRQTTVNEHAYGAERIHALVRLAKTGFRSCMTLTPLSTLNNVGLRVRQPHSPCLYCRHVRDPFDQLMFYFCTIYGNGFSVVSLLTNSSNFIAIAK